MQTFAEKVIRFYQELEAPRSLPPGVKAIEPYKNLAVMEYTKLFFRTFFSDERTRVFVLGINPGRFGSGTTGVTFTDPVALRSDCGIEHELKSRREMSSVFIYDFINEWGGAGLFYSDFFLSAVSPIGFTVNGKNYNYYDSERLFENLEPFIVRTLRAQLEFGAKDAVILLGRGQNQKVFNKINKEHGFFKYVFVLDHPRYVLQYKRKQVAEYLEAYKRVFSEALSV